MKKAMIFLAEGFEEVEAMAPVDLLRRAGVEVSILSVDGKRSVKGSHGIEIAVDDTLENADTDTADLLILPGGMPGTKNLDAHSGVRAAISKAYEEGRYVAAICAAPSVFGHLGILKGKKAVCYPGFEKELTGAEVLVDSVVVDDNVITSRGMRTAIDFGLKLTEILTDSATADKLGKGVIYEK